jgi:hypothetical protein
MAAAPEQIALEIERLSTTVQILATLYIAIAIEERTTSFLRSWWSRPRIDRWLVILMLLLPASAVFVDSIYILEVKQTLDPPQWVFTLNKVAIAAMLITLSTGLATAVVMDTGEQEDL